MTTLVLSRRYSDDSNNMRRAALEVGWDVERMQNYEPLAGLAERDPVIYGETIMADALCGPLGLVLLEPTYDWLPSLPREYVKRSIRLSRLGQVRTVSERAFIKPVDEKIFPARVYERNDAIDPECTFPDDAYVLVADPVSFELEVRAFVCERKVAALSAYIRNGDIAKVGHEWPLSEQISRP